MPRDSNGKFTLPSGTIVNMGDTVLPSQHNPAMLDIEQALTNSVARNGSARMTGNLPMGNNRITGLAPGIEPNDAATVSQAIGVPLGGVVDFWGSTPPDGFMHCAGQELSRNTYADLFAVIGTNAGDGNGSTTFNLPDYRGRTGAGRDDMGGTAAGRVTNAGSGIDGTTLGATGGSQTHTLTTAQMPSHSHTVTDPGHIHNVTNVTVGVGLPQTGGTFGIGGGTTQRSTTDISISPAGGGQAHQNMQPTIICNKIMRVQ